MYPTEVPTVKVYAGDPVNLVSYTLTDALGVPRDLTAYTGWLAHWRKSPESAEFIALTVETDQLAVGKFLVNASEAATAAMTGDGVWDVQATHPTDGPRTFAFGRTAFRKDVTRV